MQNIQVVHGLLLSVVIKFGSENSEKKKKKSRVGRFGKFIAWPGKGRRTCV